MPGRPCGSRGWRMDMQRCVDAQLGNRCRRARTADTVVDAAPSRRGAESGAPRPRFERGTYRLGEDLSCPGTRGNQDGISPPDLHTALSAGLQGHVSRRDAECRGMPFCPCCSRVDLPLRPGLVLLLCWRGRPGSQGHSSRPPARNACPSMPLPANFRLGSDAARRTSASDRIAAPLPRNPVITQRNLVRDQPQAEQGQIAD